MILIKFIYCVSDFNIWNSDHPFPGCSAEEEIQGGGGMAK